MIPWTIFAVLLAQPPREMRKLPTPVEEPALLHVQASIAPVSENRASPADFVSSHDQTAI
jgi:hypothetical protein